MTLPTLIIITGPPGTGKTTLGNRIAASFSLPFLHKDGFKELLFDALGWKDRSWSKQMSRVSYRLLFYVTEILLSAGSSLVLEANFDAVAHNQTFIDLKGRCAYRPLQILCYAEGRVLQRRFGQRGDSGRHPGHLDDVLRQELEPLLRRGYTPPLDIGGRLMKVDTTDFGRVNTDDLLQAVRSAMAQE
jgi:predicted kinase